MLIVSKTLTLTCLSQWRPLEVSYILLVLSQFLDNTLCINTLYILIVLTALTKITLIYLIYCFALFQVLDNILDCS